MSYEARKPYEEPFLAALELGKGKERAADLAGVRPQTIRYRVKRDPEFAEKVRRSCDRFAEQSVATRLRRIRRASFDD